jgi:hypothetical protein
MFVDAFLCLSIISSREHEFNEVKYLNAVHSGTLKYSKTQQNTENS